MRSQRSSEKRANQFSSDRSALDQITVYLAKRDHSEKELRTKLAKKFEPQEIEEAILEAKERKWLAAPEDLAERVTNALHRKKKGRLYIQRYLKEKGLPAHPLEDEQELEKAHELLERKFGELNSKLLSNPSDRQKIYRYLAYRGFTDETIRLAMNQKKCVD